MLESKVITGPAITRLNLITYQQGTALASKRPCLPQKLVSCRNNTGFTLNWFKNDSSHSIRLNSDQLLQIVGVVVRKVLHTSWQGSEHIPLRWLAGERQSAHGSTMKAIDCGQDTPTSSQPRDFKGHFVRFGARITKSDSCGCGISLVTAFSRMELLYQPLRQTQARFMCIEVRYMPQGG